MHQLELHDISVRKFEELSLDFLNLQDDLSAIYPAGNTLHDLGYDFKAYVKIVNNVTEAAVEVKHRKRLTKKDLTRISLRANLLISDFDGFIFVTSAEMNDVDQEFFKGLLIKAGFKFVRIYDKKSFDQQMSFQTSLVYQTIKKETQTTRSYLITGFIAVLASLVSFIFPVYESFEKDKESLDDRIENVEGALRSIKSLESYLDDIKSDLKGTAIESAAIKKEYEKAQVLKKLTTQEISALQSTIGTKPAPWWAKLFDYVIGFVLGVGASLISSVLYDKYKTRRELNAKIE